MSMQHQEIFKQKAREHVKKAREISEKAVAEKRELTTQERADYDQNMKYGQEFADKLKQAQADAEIYAKAKALGDLYPAGTNPNAAGAWAKSTVTNIRNTMGDGHSSSKALVSSTVPVSDPIVSGYGALPTAPRTVLDLLRGTVSEPDANESYSYQSLDDFKRTLFGGSGNGGNQFSFIRQTARTNNAAVVGDGGTKPTSLYTTQEIDDHYRVIAHLSEPVPQRFFQDDGALADFLGNEMANGLSQALENEALNGDGTAAAFGDDTRMTGILNTSGIQSQAYAINLLTTTRKALTLLQAAGVTPTAWVLHPTDAEAFDLLREGTGDGAFLLGGPGANAGQNLWTIPRITSVSLTPGSAILADWTAAKIVPRQEATLHIDTGGTLFQKNQVQFRMEGRYGIAVKQPRSFVTVDLTAA